jgi:hypothetical protein
VAIESFLVSLFGGHQHRNIDENVDRPELLNDLGEQLLNAIDRRNIAAKTHAWGSPRRDFT